MIEALGLLLNGWVAALGGVAVVLAVSAVLRIYHEWFVRRMLVKILEAVKSGKE